VCGAVVLPCSPTRTLTRGGLGWDLQSGLSHVVVHLLHQLRVHVDGLHGGGGAYTGTAHAGTADGNLLDDLVVEEGGGSGLEAGGNQQNRQHEDTKLVHCGEGEGAEASRLLGGREVWNTACSLF